MKKCSTPSDVEVKRVPRKSPPPMQILGVKDFYCEVCGKAQFDANYPFQHRCPGKKTTESFVDIRRETCSVCQYRDGERCTFHNPGDIKFGTTNFGWRCPQSYWLAVRVNCPKCKTPLRNFSGVSECPCGWKGIPMRIVQQPPITSFVAVTSLSEHPHHQEVQRQALASWRAFGLEVHCVNTREQIERMYPQYPSVTWHQGKTKRKLQRIHSLTQIAVKLNKPILLLNSDIEIYGDQKKLTLQPHTLTMGIRRNYTDRTSSPEKWGIDAFLLTPKMVKSLPNLPLYIGQPIWDYWLPYHFREKGYYLEMERTLFHHKKHLPFWNKDDWDKAYSIFKGHYKDEALGELGVDFRNTLPYPPGGKNAGRKPLLFHHIPKTGGTSTMNWLKECYPLHEHKHIDLPREAATLKNFHYKLWTGHGVRSVHAPHALKFTIIRNPVDRVWSWYNHEVRSGYQGTLTEWLAQKPSSHLNAYSDLNDMDYIHLFEDLASLPRELNRLAFIHTESPFPHSRENQYPALCDRDKAIITKYVQEDIKVYKEIANGRPKHNRD